MNPQKPATTASDNSGLGALIVVILLIALACTAWYFTYSKPDATRILNSANLTDVRDMTWHYFLIQSRFRCREADDFAFTAKAKNRDDQEVNVTVCTGYYWGGGDIRYK